MKKKWKIALGFLILLAIFGCLGDNSDQNASDRNQRVVHAFVTLSTLYERFGEGIMKQLFMGRLHVGERLVRRGFNFWDILIVNRDSIPKNIHSWMISISDYVIMTQGILKEEEFC